MKKMICLLLALVMTAALAACGESSAEPTEAPTKAPTTAPTEPPTETPTEPETEAATEAATEAKPGNIDLKAFIKAFNTKPALEEQAVYDKDKVKVTVTDIVYDTINGPTLNISVDNKTDKNLMAQSDCVVVNGYMVAGEMDIAAKAGAVSKGTLVIPYTSLAIAEISSIAQIEFSVRILEQKSFEVIAESDMISLITSGYEDYEPTFDDKGQTALNSKGVKIVFKGMDRREIFDDGPTLLVYMYNGTKKSVTIQACDIKVNGYEFTSAMNTTIIPGKHAVDVLTFFNMDMQEYGIEHIDNIELVFEIHDEESWDLITKTKKISYIVESE